MSEIENKIRFGGLVGDLKEELQAIEEVGRQRIHGKKREALERKKSGVIETQERISQTIATLYDVVYHYPDRATPEILMDFVHKADGNFSPLVKERFTNAIEGYRKKRALIRSFIGENRDPVVMFEKCFGVAPKGKVEVKPGPMTICFRCYEDEDYIAAFIHGDVPESREERAGKIEKAKKSGGAAFSQVKVSELAGCVIAERVGNNFEDVPTYTKREVRIQGREKNTWQHFQYPTEADSNLIIFNIPTVGEVEAHLRRDEKGNVSGLSLVQDVEIADFGSLL